MSSKKYALISVYDKTGLEPFARKLIGQGFKIISTGKTASFLKEKKIPVEEVSDYTGFPEILEGRVKTLHPKIHAGILSRRDKVDQKTLNDLDIPAIDLVVVNLYPFESTPTIENIDIGGPTLLRAAAKNFEHVTVVCDPADYKETLVVIARSGSDEAIPASFRRNLAAKVFARIAEYDRAIADFFSLPVTLRYGENPHQKASWRVETTQALWEPPLQGKELSYNNILDADAAFHLIQEFAGDSLSVCAIIKHSNPCGVALSQKSSADAFEKALDCDSLSAFGGIVAFNGEVDEKCANALLKIFLEVVLAQKFSKKALSLLSAKKNLRLLQSRPTQSASHTLVRSAGGGALVQENDSIFEDPASWQIKTKRKPTLEEMQALQFAWKVAKHVKSNAIVFASEDRTLGIGAGQMSRIDAVKIAEMKMNATDKTVVTASDAFFPFPDSIDAIAKAGATAIIQPGGSLKDPEVISAANRHNLAMVFTGVRHFRH